MFSLMDLSGQHNLIAPQHPILFQDLRIGHRLVHGIKKASPYVVKAAPYVVKAAQLAALQDLQMEADLENMRFNLGKSVNEFNHAVSK